MWLLLSELLVHRTAFTAELQKQDKNTDVDKSAGESSLAVVSECTLHA